MSAQTQAEPMTPEQLLEAHPCPPWCTVSRATHLAEMSSPLDRSTFHCGEVIDEWHLVYRGLEIRVAMDQYVSDYESGETVVTVAGDISRGSADYSELNVEDARRLGLALLKASEVAGR